MTEPRTKKPKARELLVDFGTSTYKKFYPAGEMDAFLEEQAKRISGLVLLLELDDASTENLMELNKVAAALRGNKPTETVATVSKSKGGPG